MRHQEFRRSNSTTRTIKSNKNFHEFKNNLKHSNTSILSNEARLSKEKYSATSNGNEK